MDRPTSAQQGIIIVRLLGGLGNQMFQYALGRSLALSRKRDLKLDLNFYKNQNTPWAKRSYALSVFNIQTEEAKADELKPFNKYLQQNIISKTLRRLSNIVPIENKSYIFEPVGENFTYNPLLSSTKLKPVVYLDGFWQTEKYFKQIENVIRKDFEFKNLPDEINRAMLNDISKQESVAIHIRHGDNATGQAKHHGVLPLEYYYDAVLGLTKTVGSPHFYIFSDDIKWAKENLKLNYPTTFVSHNGEEKHHEDLRLMSNCKHHIIGNSTFSWWGAYLGKKPNQLVFAPGRYHINTNIKMNDYYPETWKIISI